MIMSNPILKTIKDRRSSIRFMSTPVENEKLNTILEAGRWAPSWTNTQPWRFIVVKDEKIKERMSSAVSTFFSLSVKEAPVCIVICVNPMEDPFHFIEDGTAASQNMALVAQSVGLSTSWIGVFSLKNEKKSSERKIKKILQIPNEWRLISILPLGIPKYKETKTRKDLSKLVYYNKFMETENNEITLKEKKDTITEIQKSSYPSSAREIERALV